MSKKVNDDGSRSNSYIAIPFQEQNLGLCLASQLERLNMSNTKSYVGFSNNNKSSTQSPGYKTDNQNLTRDFTRDRNKNPNGYLSREAARNKLRANIPEEPPDWIPPPEILAKLEKENIFPLKKKSTRFTNAKYFCRSCDYHCDTIEICKRHSHDARHIHTKELKLLENMLRNFPPPTEAQMEYITELIESTAAAQGITEDEISLRKEVKNELEKLLFEAVPGASLEISGSTLSGFALKSSNLDIDVIVPEDIKHAIALLAILNIIEKNDKYSNIVNDLSSSYPCMTFTHTATGIGMVVGVSSPAARNTNILLSHYNNLDSRVKPLVTTFRYWAKLCQIDNQHTGSLPAHCFPLMVIHFLQQTSPSVLPILHALNPSSEPDHYLTPSELDPPWKSTNSNSLGRLWFQMLYFYSVEFKMATNAINIRSAEPISRKDRTWGKRMSIEDPFQSKRNLTRTVSSTSVFDYISNRIKMSYKYFATPQLHFGYLFKHVEREKKKSSLYTSSESDTLEDIPDEDHAKLGKVLDGNDGDEEENCEDDDDDSNSGETDDYEETKRNESKSPVNMEEPSTSPVEDGDPILELNDSYISDEPLILSEITQTIDRITYRKARSLMVQIQKEQFCYSFVEYNFTEGKKVPLFCVACRKTGHDKTICKEDELPPLKPLPQLSLNYYRRLSLIFQDLKNECTPTPKEIEDRDYIVNDLEAYIRQSFPGTMLKLFGSSANGFGFGHSDLDICLTFQGHLTGEHFNYIQVIEEIAEKLKKFRPVRQVLAITTAKVPIVKFTVKTQRRVHLDADLSLYNTLALQNTQLLNTYANIDPRVKILGYALKYFAKLCDMGDASRGSLSSYAYILMVIHFLQQCSPPVIPVLQKLHDPAKPAPEHIIDGWNAWFFSDTKNLPKIWKDYGKNQQSPGELWVNLLRYYTETFNWKDNVVTIRQHEPLSRLMKLWTTQCIAIEDPFDLSHNLGAGLSRKMNTYIMKAFIRGRELFGSGYESPPIGQGYRDLIEFLFDTHQLTDGAPPNDRGCRLCGKIGHMVKECPRKRQKRDAKKDFSKDSIPKHDGKVPVEEPNKGEERQTRNLDSKGPTVQNRILRNLPKDMVVKERLAQPEKIQVNGPAKEGTHKRAWKEEELVEGPVSTPPKDTSPLSLTQFPTATFNHSVQLNQSQLNKSFSEPNALSMKSSIDPSMLFQMANQFGGGAIHLPGSPPINFKPTRSSTIPLGSPISPISSISPTSPPYFPQFGHPNMVDTTSLVKDKTITIPPPGFSNSSPVQRSPIQVHSNSLSNLILPQHGPRASFQNSIQHNTPPTPSAFETLCQQKEAVSQVLNSHQIIHNTPPTTSAFETWCQQQKEVASQVLNSHQVVHNTPPTTSAFETWCQQQKEAASQVLNSHHQQQQLMMNERQQQLFLKQQQQLRMQEQHHHLRIQEQQQQYMYQLNMQQPGVTNSIKTNQHFHSSPNPQGVQHPMDGNAFISHLMSQVSTGNMPQRLPDMPQQPVAPPPGLESKAMHQMNYPLPLSGSPLQQLQWGVSQQGFSSDFRSPDNSFQGGTTPNPGHMFSESSPILANVSDFIRPPMPLSQDKPSNSGFGSQILPGSPAHLLPTSQGNSHPPPGAGPHIALQDLHYGE